MRKLLPFVLLLALLVGCATSWQNAAGKTLVTTSQTVDAAMKGWAMYVVISNPPVEQQSRVKMAYQQYQLAMDGALKAYNAAVTLQDQSVYVRASAALQASSRNILALIATFNPKQK